ncbi:hypothetical protein, partial [Candidatus Symbiopectobacterium sp. NZEC135]|uniref:hypothetical protein n=1 Tax=Candidatus Symbiopectobacterium sp. NZEC135 TaxID=2820471 RepID=UPI0022277DE4
EPSIRFHVYTLSRRAPSATQTPHRIARHQHAAATGANVGKLPGSVNEFMQQNARLAKLNAIC